MGLHKCTEAECPAVGQWTTRTCGCHKTNEEVLCATIREMLAADDAMLAFVLCADPKKLGEAEWARQHADCSGRRRTAVDAARAVLKEI